MPAKSSIDDSFQLDDYDKYGINLQGQIQEFFINEANLAMAMTAPLGYLDLAGLLSNCLKGCTKGRYLFKVISLHVIYTSPKQQNNRYDATTAKQKSHKMLETNLFQF